MAELTAYTPADAPDVMALWEAEARIPEAEAQRRLGEVLLVARDGDDLAGVTTAWIDVHPQLRVPLWHGRVLVAEGIGSGMKVVTQGAELLDQVR